MTRQIIIVSIFPAADTITSKDNTIIIIPTFPVADTIAPKDFTRHSSVVLSRSVDVGNACSKLLF
jgi:hypothetical protein